MTTKYGAGTDPLGLDTAKFEFIGRDSGEEPDIKDIANGSGGFKQGTCKKIKYTETLKYYCETDTPSADAPAIGATCSGWEVVGRQFSRADEQHATMTLQVRSHGNVSLTFTY